MRELDENFYHLRFLQYNRVDPYAAWIYAGDHEMADGTWMHRERMDQLTDVITLPEPEPGTLPPTAVSSWAECSAAGLVERGWYDNPHHRDDKFWGLRLTPLGREKLIPANKENPASEPK